MARFDRDRYHGGWKVSGLDRDIEKARRNQKFSRDMGDISSRATGSIAGQAAKTTGGVLLGGAAVGLGMIANFRFRYLVQVVLHLIMAFVVVYVAAMIFGASETTGLSNEEFRQWVGSKVMVGVIGSAIWTAIYVIFRTIPKMMDT